MKNPKIITAIVIIQGGLFLIPPGQAVAKEKAEDLKKRIEVLERRIAELEGQPPVRVYRQAVPARYYFRAMDPFAEMGSFRQAMDRMWDVPVFPPSDVSPLFVREEALLSPEFDLEETPKEYKVIFNIVGLDKDKIKVDAKVGALTVSGEDSKQEQEQSAQGSYSVQSFSSFLRTIPLPEDADTKKMTTETTERRLIIKIPRRS